MTHRRNHLVDAEGLAAVAFYPPVYAFYSLASTHARLP
jgi:hypothetical protein